jgi:hypothetical protein
MNPALSLQQAPPLSVPMRFFVTAPVFGMAAGLLLLWVGPEALASRWSPPTLALTHLAALGVLAMVMCGALLQMLPVLAGVVLARPRLLAAFVHAMLAAGALALAFAFLSLRPALFVAAAVLLGGAILVFLIAVGLALARAPQPGDSVRGMRWALFGLAMTAALGLPLALGHAAIGLPLWRFPATDVHLAWGLVGWVAMLVAVVSWQVVPMFQMTPAYPMPLRRALAGVLTVLLLWLSLAAWRGWPLAWLPELLIAILLAIHAGLTLRLLSKRRRRHGDASLRFWQLGMAALLGASLLATAARWLPAAASERLAMAAAVLFIAGFAIPVVCAMLYKIVPFLVFLHLQQRIGANPAARHRRFPPNMKTLLPEPGQRRHLWIHAAALVLTLAGLAWPPLLHGAGLAWLLAFALLEAHLIAALRRHRAECRQIDACTGEPLPPE